MYLWNLLPQFCFTFCGLKSRMFYLNTHTHIDLCVKVLIVFSVLRRITVRALGAVAIVLCSSQK